MTIKELKPEELVERCDIGNFDFETTKSLEPIDSIIGQGRAASSMEFGLAIKRFGYNIYVSGIIGTGRNSYTKKVVNNIAKNEKTPDDWCYVYNFKQPDIPKCINLPAGMGYKLEKDMKRLVKTLKIKIPKAFNGEDYEKQKNKIVQDYQEKSSEYMDEFNKYANQSGFAIKRSEEGLITVPILNGKPIDEKDFITLPPEERKKLEDTSFVVQNKLMEMMKHVRDIEKIVRDKMEHLESKIALIAVEHPIMELREKYSENKFVVEYLTACQRDIIHNIEDFRGIDRENMEELEIMERMNQKDYTFRYQVNLVVDNRDLKGAPVIFDSNPKYENLMGRIEYDSQMGVITTDFTKIKSGTLHIANGGYLILSITDIARSPESWEGLKRALKTSKIHIENIYSGLVSGGMKPEPIPLNIKIILLGNPQVYQTLYTMDEDFNQLFKIKADFDVDMEDTVENIKKYAQFISAHCEKKGLLHFDKEATAIVVEYSRKLSEHKHKLSTKFNDIMEILYEADAWARIDGLEYINKVIVKKTIYEKIYRSNRIEEKLQEYIDTGVILITTQDSVVGQVNGLSVMNYGDYSFGKPSRITANTFAGESGIVNIEREVEMSGAIHDKGVLILSGFLGERFAQEFPMSVSASITFEQLYDGVEGDSASSTELYAMLSSLSGVPIKQGIAVTGSVNQKGEIQPIGGVNEKIEGFFQTCKARGLTGSEGVMIPHQNEVNLMLGDEVIEAVKNGKFHIYAVEKIEEGIEVLTGLEAGIKSENGDYPIGTLFDLVQKKLYKYAQIVEEFNDKHEE